MIDRRKLDSIEVEVGAVAHQGLGQAVLKYHGFLDVTALREALAILAARYPILSGRIIVEDEDYVLCLTGGASPKLCEMSGDLNTLLQERGRSLDSHWRDEQGNWTKSSRRTLNSIEWLARITVATEGHEGFVLFEVSHAIVDGAGFIQLHQELWRIYSQIVTGVRPAADVVEGLPLSPRRLITERLRLAESPSRSMAARNRQNQPTGLDAIAKDGAGGRTVHSIRLSEIATTRLLKLAHSRAVSVGELVLAEISLVFRKCKQTTDTVNISTNVNLRPFAIPPVGTLETSNFVGAIKVSVSLSDASDTTEVAQRLHHELRLSINDGRFIVPGHSDNADTQGILDSDIHLNNAGRINGFTQAPGLCFIEFIPILSYMWPDFPDWPHKPPVCIIMFTYDNKMSILFQTSEHNVGLKVQERLRYLTTHRQVGV